jgi:hypothetical protein
VLFELFYDPPREMGIDAWKRWLQPRRFPLWTSMALATLYFLGKRFGSNSLFNDSGYRPVFTWQQLIGRQAAFWNAWLEPWVHRANLIPGPAVLPFYAVLIAVAATRRTVAWRMAVAIGMAATLPIAFVPSREGPATYVPFFGWAMLFAMVIAACIHWLSAAVPLQPGARAAVRVLLFSAVLAATWRANERVRRFEVAHFHPQQAKISDVIVEFQNHAPKIHPRSAVLILDDPFPGAWDTSFVARLWYADKSLEFWLGNMMQPKPGPGDYARFDYVLGFQPDGALVELKPPADRASLF